MEPTRARPVPFCFHSFLPAPETSLRFLVAAVPCRWRRGSASPLPTTAPVHLLGTKDFVRPAQASRPSFRRDLLRQCLPSSLTSQSFRRLRLAAGLKSEFLKSVRQLLYRSYFFLNLQRACWPSTGQPCPSRQIHDALCGGGLALEMTTYPFARPGTAPSTISKFSSRSMPRMRRLRTVTRSTPKWPGMRCPGNTRDGNEEAPIEPCTWNM